MNALTTKGDFDDFSRPPRRIASPPSRFSLWLQWMSFWRITSAKPKNRSVPEAPATDRPLEDWGSSVSGSWRENPRKGMQVRRACADT